MLDMRASLHSCTLCFHVVTGQNASKCYFFSVFNHLCTTLLSHLQRVSPSPASCHRLSGATPAPPCLMVWSLSILTWLVAQHARDSRRKRPQRLQDLFQKTTVIKKNKKYSRGKNKLGRFTCIWSGLPIGRKEINRAQSEWVVRWSLKS